MCISVILIVSYPRTINLCVEIENGYSNAPSVSYLGPLLNVWELRWLRWEPVTWSVDPDPQNALLGSPWER